MKPIKLSKLLYHLYDTTLSNDIDIMGLALDSRHVKPGDLFFAFKGTHLDGRKFIDDAIEKGAHAVLAESDSEYTHMRTQRNVPIYPVSDVSKRIGAIAAVFYGSPSKKLHMIGITGTNGKTSSAFFIGAALQQMGKACGIIGTLGNGLYGKIEPGNLTTPDAITLQAKLADFVKQRVKFAAMEVSSHSLEQGRVNGLTFEVSLFTNLTRDHLDYHGTMEAYGAAKKKLFYPAFTKKSVINADDAFGQQLIEALAQDKTVFAYSCHKNVKLPPSIPCSYAEKIHLDLSGITAQVITPWGEGQLKIPLLGLFNLSNALGVLTTLCLLDIPFAQALTALQHISPVPGRMQTLGGRRKPLIVVDYAHTPDALEKVLIALRAHCKGKLYCVFGCGGDRDSGKRPLMAGIAEKYADQVMVTDDNPRTEDPAQIVADICKGFADPQKIIVEHDRSKAIRDVIQYAQIHDCVLIAGKGAEAYQQIGNEKLPFSDVEQVEKNLGEK